MGTQGLVDTTALKQPVDIIHRSPGITAIYNELKNSTRNSVLDLGSASSASFQFFSRLSCHIHFESMDDFFEECGDAWISDDALRAGLDEYLSVFPPSKKFDVILAWDIFNYLDGETLQWLIERLNSHCRPNTLLHTIKYVGRNLPAVPRHFQILDQYQTRMHCTGVLCSRPFPLLDTAKLLKSLRSYTMEYTYMQQEGMVQDVTEQVLRYQPEGKRNNRQIASAEMNTLPHRTLAHRSYGLEMVCEQLQRTADATVLDLGGKPTRNGDFFLQYAENFYVEDVLPSLHKSPEEKGALLRQHALRFDEAVKFDVILAWDIFNFCSAEQVAAVYEKLRPHLHGHTLIFAFFYTGMEIPERSQKCYVQNEKEIALLPTPKKPAADSEFNAVTLLRILRDFSLAKTWIMKPGMQRGIYEYVFQSRPK